MNICNIWSDFSPSRGGVETSILEISNYLRRRNLASSCLLTKRLMGDAFVEDYGALKCYRLTPDFFGSDIHRLRLIGYGLQLFENSFFEKIGYFKAKKIVGDSDVFVTHSLNLVDLPHNLSNYFKKPWILYFHGRIGNDDGDMNLTINSKKKLNFASLILVNRPSSFFILKKAFGQKVHLLSPYVNCSVFQPANFNPCLENAKNLLFVGRLVERKDPITPLLAVKMLKEVEPEIKLHILGSGPLYPKMLELTKTYNLTKNVIFHGLVTDTSAYLFYNAIFLATSPFTNYPSKSLLEAMSAGLAIIATDVGETHLLIKQFKNGLLIPPKNPAALAQAILLLYRNQDLLRKLSFAARLTAEENTIENFSDRYLQLLHSVIKN